MDNDTKKDHAEQNAAAWYASICEMVAALECDYDRRDGLREEQFDHDAEEGPRWRDANPEEAQELAELVAAATIDGHECKDADEARERIEEAPLSVEVRADWHAPCDDLGDGPTEFRVLLTTGGPALQLVGELDERRQPCRAWLEYQDWGTGWRQYFGADSGPLLAFASCFYFGG